MKVSALVRLFATHLTTLGYMILVNFGKASPDLFYFLHEKILYILIVKRYVIQLGLHGMYGSPGSKIMDFFTKHLSCWNNFHPYTALIS